MAISFTAKKCGVILTPETLKVSLKSSGISIVYVTGVYVYGGGGLKFTINFKHVNSNTHQFLYTNIKNTL